MVRVLVAGIIALVISIALGPKFIEFLRRNEFGQQLREEGPHMESAKHGTPVMGGLLMMLSMTVAYLLVGKYTLPGLAVLFVTLSCATLGFADDYIKLRHRRSLGLRGRWKMIGLVAITAITGYLAHQAHLSTKILLPVVDWNIPLSYAWYPFLFVIIAGAANGVNLADGLDGLAAGTGIISVFTFMAMGTIAYIRSNPIPADRSVSKLDLGILAAALIGSAIGFLWYNAFPAEVFMGDTGSMAIGGALAGFAIFTKTELLLLLIGGIFVVEALSVMLQVFAFKYLGRRLFLMTPIHHHFEMKAWSETKIMVRFWILCGILCAAGFALYYRYYFRQ
jgi:phospho-N-acetylmuramoyl-pentapeptide-transferase